MASNRLKVGDKFRLLQKETYPGGAFLRKQGWAEQRVIFTVQSKDNVNYYFESPTRGSYTANDECVAPANKPTIIIKRK
jgi:hypothetical protein